MDCQPMIRKGRNAMVPWMALAISVACTDDESAEPHFDGPVAAAVLYPEDGGPFEEPVAFVSNSRSGRITPLDLKGGRLLTDDLAASFLRASYIATGRARILGPIAVWAADTETVTLFVSDFANDVLLEVPYIVSVDSEPVELAPQATEPVFVDADGSGDNASMDDLQLRTGYTTTEDWVVEYDGEYWLATGSRSGPQYLEASFEQEYHTGNRELEFTITGSATAGDYFTLSTDTGIVEHDVGGAVQDLSLAPGTSSLALCVFDRDTGESALSLFDAAQGQLVGTIPLPDGAQPYRLDWDDSGSLLYVADAALSFAYEIIVDMDSPDASSVRQIPAPGPLVDLAYLATDDYERLALAPAGTNRVDILDLATDELLNVNPYTEQVEGLDLGSPVTGLAAAPVPVLTQQTTEWGARIEKDVVVVSLFEGRMVMLDMESGCLVQDATGPHSYEDSSAYFGFSDQGEPSSPYLWEDESSTEHVMVNECAGVALSETWTVTWDEMEQAWWVEGTVSGLQENMAFNDLRYVSDQGAISFTIMSGAAPATEGDQYTLSIVDGVMDFDGDLNGDGSVDKPLELPGRPTCFWYDSGPTGGGWDQLDRRVFALWPIMNSDYTLRARLTSGDIEILWD